MKRFRILVLLFVLVFAAGAYACPACKDQVPTQKSADGRPLVDPYETQKGFALSIYVLLSAVYGLPCVLGFMLWRSVKSARARNRARRAMAGVPLQWAPAREEAGS